MWSDVSEWRIAGEREWWRGSVAAGVLESLAVWATRGSEGCLSGLACACGLSVVTAVSRTQLEGGPTSGIVCPV